MEFIKKMMRKEVTAHIKSYKTIEISETVPPMPPLMNHKCMYNALNEVKSKRAVLVLEVIGETNAVAHYLCMNNKGGIYDPTLGWSWGGCDYKLIRYIHDSNTGHDNMGEALIALKDKEYAMLSLKTRVLSKLFLINHYDVF